MEVVRTVGLPSADQHRANYDNAVNRSCIPHNEPQRIIDVFAGWRAELVSSYADTQVGP
jgi:hypothetical protein